MRTRRSASIALTAALLAGAGASIPSIGAQAKPLPSSTHHTHRPLNILLTNDDGWRGAGGSSTPLIVALRDALKRAGDHVVVVAPGTDQSGQGGRISLPPNQLTVARPESDVWTVTPGSPSDSVFFALDEVFPDGPPDLVVSGINPGNNLGQAVNHSGTVNAATAAIELGVPSIAVSLQTLSTWPEGTAQATPAAASYVADLVTRLQEKARGDDLMPADVSLNVNLPLLPGPTDPSTGKPTSVLPPKGTRVTTLATGVALDVDYQNTSGATGAAGVYTITLQAAAGPSARRTDVRAVQDGFVSVTPLEADRDLDRSTEAWLRGVL